MGDLLYNAPMPEYLPFNERHSIQETQINLLFEGQFVPEAVEAARDRGSSALSIELPNVAEIRGGSLQINISNPVSEIPLRTSQPDQLVGFQMSAVQRNSQPARILRLANNLLSVSILDYVSWEDTLGKVLTYIGPVLSFLPILANPVTAYGIRTIDRFTYTGRPVDARADQLLIQGNLYVTPRTFGAGPDWHCNSGWFNYTLGDRVLHNLNVASNRVELSSTVTIDHNATIQLSSRRNSIENLLQAVGDTPGLVDGLNSLHDQNKDILREMLTPEMLTKIGLLS